MSINVFVSGLLDEHFSPNNSTLYGTLFNNSITSSDEDLCSDACFSSDTDCQAFTLSSTVCYLYTNVSNSPGTTRNYLQDQLFSGMQVIYLGTEKHLHVIMSSIIANIVVFL